MSISLGRLMPSIMRAHQRVQHCGAFPMNASYGTQIPKRQTYVQCTYRKPLLSCMKRHEHRATTRPAASSPGGVSGTAEGFHVAVVGSGVIGLATAVQLLDEYPDVCVDVFSDKEISDTTSHGSGGLWEPYQIAGTSDELVNRWGRRTFAHLSQLLASKTAAECGVQLVSGFALFTNPHPQRPSWHDIVYGFRALDRRQIQGLGMPQFASGWAFDTIVADQSRYLPYLLQRAQASGRMSLVRRSLRNLGELSSEGFSVIFNCTGLASAMLLQDRDCFPIRGQVMRVRAPWLKHVYMFDDNHYVIPQVDSVVLGGTQQRGRYDTDIDENDLEDILKRVSACIPSLASADIVMHWAGLRPARQTGVRIERESASVHGVPVVHNYGHGGSGVTLHWGCVEEALHLAEPDLQVARGDGFNLPNA